MAKLPSSLKDLCSPAAVYFVLSMVSLVIIAIQNLGNTNKYIIGDFSCNFPSIIILFIFKIIYILFWTYLLNLICKDGHETLSWLLVFLPIIIFFIILSLILYYY